MQWIYYDVGNKSDFFVTTDDDCFVNIRANIAYFLTSKEENLKQMYCGFNFDDKARPIRYVK